MRNRTTFLTISVAGAVIVGLVSIAAVTQAEARGQRAAAMPNMAAKSGGVVRDPRTGATPVNKLHCQGSACPKRYGDKAPTTGTYKPLPPTISNGRDHRGPKGGGGGVTVTSGPPRRPDICAGWGC
ncbi:MAG: hypothetical protein K2Y71_25390 [Xanthobacteraceae bacterium]|nr:hypothetical protein [Xanthobacteraceae bacterium]